MHFSIWIRYLFTSMVHVHSHAFKLCNNKDENMFIFRLPISLNDYSALHRHREIVIRPTSDHICQRCRCNSKMAFHHTNLRYLESNFTGKNVMKCRSSRDKSPTKAIKCKWQEQEPEKREKKNTEPTLHGFKKIET